MNALINRHIYITNTLLYYLWNILVVQRNISSHLLIYFISVWHTRVLLSMLIINAFTIICSQIYFHPCFNISSHTVNGWPDLYSGTCTFYYIVVFFAIYKLIRMYIWLSFWVFFSIVSTTHSRMFRFIFAYRAYFMVFAFNGTRQINPPPRFKKKTHTQSFSTPYLIHYYNSNLIIPINSNWKITIIYMYNIA